MKNIKKELVLLEKAVDKEDLNKSSLITVKEVKPYPCERCKKPTFSLIGVCEKCEEKGWWVDPAGGLHRDVEGEFTDPAAMYEKKKLKKKMSLKEAGELTKDTIIVKKTNPYGGFYSDPNGDKFYKDEKGNIYTKVGNEWYICTSSGEPYYPIKRKIIIKESKFARVMGKFNDYASKVVGMLKRKGIEETHELDLSLITRCFCQGITATHCGEIYLKQLNTISENKKMKNKIKESFEGQLKESVSENLYDIGQEIDNNDLLPGFAGMEGEGDDVLRIDYNGGQESIWLYTNGSVDGRVTPKVKLFLQSKGFKFNKLKESKKNLKEGTSHEIPSPKYMVNYEEQDVVTAIKEAFKNYDGCTCKKIAAVGDSQFYNIEVSIVESDIDNLEAKRFVIAQRLHKLRAELFADLTTIIPVVNINLAKYEFVKNTDNITAVFTLLMSQTNQRDWVTGAYKQRDKKLSDKLEKALEVKREVKESLSTNDKLKNLFEKKN